MSYCQGGIYEGLYRDYYTIRVIKGDTRSLDYSLSRVSGYYHNSGESDGEGGENEMENGDYMLVSRTRRTPNPKVPSP